MCRANYHLPRPRACVIHPRWSNLGAAERVEGCTPAMVEGDYNIEKEVFVTAGQVLVEMHMTDWAAVQREDPVLDAVLNWLEAQKKISLEILLGEYISSEESQMV